MIKLVNIFRGATVAAIFVTLVSSAFASLSEDPDTSTAIVAYSGPATTSTEEHQVLIYIDPNFLKRSQSAIFIDQKLLRSGVGNVHILFGTSTAGKTTLIDRLLSSDKKLLDYSLDRCCCRAIDADIKTKYPRLYQQIVAATNQYVYELLPYNESEGEEDEPGDRLISLPGATELQTAQAQSAIWELTEKINQKAFEVDYRSILHSIFHTSFEEIIQHSQDGRSIVFDVISIRSAIELWKRQFFGPMRIQLVFLPFNELSKRMKIRNDQAVAQGTLSNQRKVFPLKQYVQLYRPIENSSELVLETLSKDQAIEAMSRHNLDKSLQVDILHKLGFTSPDITEVAITSRFTHYDDIVFTG